MVSVQRSVDIKAAPDETMSLLSDASRWPDWYPGMTKIDIAGPSPDERGTVAFKVRSAGLSMSITETVLDYQPGSCSFGVLLSVMGNCTHHGTAAANGLTFAQSAR